MSRRIGLNSVWLQDGAVVGIDFTSVGNLFEDVVDTASDVVDTAASAITDPAGTAKKLVDDVVKAVDDVVTSLADSLPDELKPFALGVGEVAKAIGSGLDLGIGAVQDVLDVASSLPWADISALLQAAASTVPLLGTAVADVIATAEIAVNALQALAHGNWLELAIKAAYKFALATIPAAASLRVVLDPLVDALIRLAVGREKPTSAILHALIDSVPDSPSFGHLSPRSIASSLASVVVGHRGLKDVGLDLVAEASGAAGPYVERATRTAERVLQRGASPTDALQIALDMAPVSIQQRAQIQDLQQAISDLPVGALPEEIAALGAQKFSGVWPAVEKTIGPMGRNTKERLMRMMTGGAAPSILGEVSQFLQPTSPIIRRPKTANEALILESQIQGLTHVGTLPPGAAAIIFERPLSVAAVSRLTSNPITPPRDVPTGGLSLLARPATVTPGTQPKPVSKIALVPSAPAIKVPPAPPPPPPPRHRYQGSLSARTEVAPWITPVIGARDPSPDERRSRSLWTTSTRGQPTSS